MVEVVELYVVVMVDWEVLRSSKIYIDFFHFHFLDIFFIQFESSNYRIEILFQMN